MSWLPFRRPTPLPELPPKPEPAEEDEAPPSSFAAKVEKWKAIFRAQRAAEPTPGQLEQARARRRRELMEAEAERIAAHVAYKGVFVEGEPLEGPEMPRGDGMGGLFQDRQADFDWQARVREGQPPGQQAEPGR